MINIVLVRHSITLGNIHKRYVGITDEELCDKGRALLKEINYPDVDIVYTSPLKRCIETASIIYPGMEHRIVDGLKECNFGEFENKNYIELSRNESYLEWINSGGKNKFPGGEDIHQFKNRCIQAFESILNESNNFNYGTVGIIAHGGTIMSIMEEFAYPKKDYYSWHVDNANGYLIEADAFNRRITLKCTIH